MSPSLDLQDLEKESRRVFAEDGLLYVFIGLLMLLIGAAFAVPALTGLVGLSALLIFPLERLRRRVTYPRLGYASFSMPSGSVRGILGFAAVAVILLALLGFAGGGRYQTYFPLAFSVVFSLSFYFGMSTHGMRARDWFLIALMLAAGLLATWRFEDWHDGAAALFGFMGLTCLAVGLVKLARFMRKYPPLPQVEE